MVVCIPNLIVTIVMIEMKATRKYLHVALSIMLYKTFLTFKSVCDYLNRCYRAVHCTSMNILQELFIAPYKVQISYLLLTYSKPCLPKQSTSTSLGWTKACTLCSKQTRASWCGCCTKQTSLKEREWNQTPHIVSN